MNLQSPEPFHWLAAVVTLCISTLVGCQPWLPEGLQAVLTREYLPLSNLCDGNTSFHYKYVFIVLVQTSLCILYTLTNLYFLQMCIIITLVSNTDISAVDLILCFCYIVLTAFEDFFFFLCQPPDHGWQHLLHLTALKLKVENDFCTRIPSE